MDVELWTAVGRGLTSDIPGIKAMLRQRLADEPSPLFKALLTESFTNSRRDVLQGINEFIRWCSQTFDIRAVYLEMNGFDINYDRWYFDYFGYDRYHDDPQDHDWLAYWTSGKWPETTLTGLERVQSDFKQFQEEQMYRDIDHSNASEIATLLVMTDFVSLVGESVEIGNLLKEIPVLATAHDFDIVGRFGSGS